jgi:hypothetical protein
MLDQQISEFGLEVHPWVFFENFLDQLGRDLMKTQTKQFEPGTEVDQRYFVCHATWDPRRGV